MYFEYKKKISKAGISQSALIQGQVHQLKSTPINLVNNTPITYLIHLFNLNLEIPHSIMENKFIRM